MRLYPFLAGVFTQSLPDAITALVAFTGLFGGAAHYAAVLARWDKDRVERATATGFFFGFAACGLGLLIDYTA
jgi:hypothetical protein